MHTIEITPQPCMVCGRGNTPNGDDGTRPVFVDLERDVNWNDSAILCEDCAVKVGSIVGMLSPDDRGDLEKVIEKKDKEIHSLKSELDTVHRKLSQHRARTEAPKKRKAAA